VGVGQVLRLAGVVPDVVEFPGTVGAADVLVMVGADRPQRAIVLPNVLGKIADARFEGVHRWLGSQVLGDDPVAGFGFRVGMERPPLGLFAELGGVDPDFVEECRAEVGERDEVLDGVAAGERPAVDDERDVEQRVVQAVLVVHQAVVADVLAVVAGDDEDRILPLAVGFEHVSEFADPVVEVGDFGAVEPPEDLEVAVGHLDRARNVSPRVLWDGHRLVVADARREELFGDLFGRAVFEVGFEVVDEQEERTRVGAVSEPVLDPLVGPSGSVVVLAAEELSVDGICDVGDGVSGEEPAGECFEFVPALLGPCNLPEVDVGLDVLPGSKPNSSLRSAEISPVVIRFNFGASRRLPRPGLRPRRDLNLYYY